MKTLAIIIAVIGIIYAGILVGKQAVTQQAAITANQQSVLNSIR